MEARLQRRVQRYGWDYAAATYESLWRSQLMPAQAQVLACAGLAPGERVLDVACGTGTLAIEVAARVSPGGYVLGIDLSGRMVDTARDRARERRCSNLDFRRMDAEQLELPDNAAFDAALCTLGLMYMPNPHGAVQQMHRIVGPDGRIVLAVWGRRERCGWAPLFPIIDNEVASDVCPLFFRLGEGDALAQLCTTAGFTVLEQFRISSVLLYGDDDEACDAAFVGGPVALAWSRLDGAARRRVRTRYLASVAAWRHGDGFRIPAEFVVVAASKRAL